MPSVEISSNASSSGTPSQPLSQVIIALQLPGPYEPLHIHLPTSEIAKPVDPNDPTTTAFDDNWIKNIAIKTFRQLDLIVEEYDLHDKEHFLDELKTHIVFPEISKKTFEHYFQFSIHLPTTGHFIELYTSQLLQHFVNFYTNPPPDRILVLHLELVGKARCYIKQLLCIELTTPSTTSNVQSITVSPTGRNNITSSPLTVNGSNTNHSTTTTLLPDPPASADRIENIVDNTELHRENSIDTPKNKLKTVPTRF
jgi:hypothetical protein